MGFFILHVFNLNEVSLIFFKWKEFYQTTLFVLINAGQIIAGLMFAGLMFANFL